MHMDAMRSGQPVSVRGIMGDCGRETLQRAAISVVARSGTVMLGRVAFSEALISVAICLCRCAGKQCGQVEFYGLGALQRLGVAWLGLIDAVRVGE